MSIDHTHGIKILIIARFKECMKRLKVSGNISDEKIKIPLISSVKIFEIFLRLLTRIHFMEGIPQALIDGRHDSFKGPTARCEQAADRS